MFTHVISPSCLWLSTVRGGGEGVGGRESYFLNLLTTRLVYMLVQSLDPAVFLDGCFLNMLTKCFALMDLVFNMIMFRERHYVETGICIIYL